MRIVLLGAIVLAGCGRIGYEPLAGGGADTGTPVDGAGGGDAGPGLPGNETPVPSGQVVPVKLRAGDYHTCALYSNGGVKCWGNNDAGQLGYGNFETLGDQSSEVGDDMLPFIDFGTADVAIDIGAGQFHSCALLASGGVRCWGTNQAGSLGNERSGSFPSPVEYLLPSGVRPLVMKVQKRNVCIIYDDATLRCSGQNDYGQLGIESFESLGDAPGEMRDALPPVDLGVGLVAEDVVLGDYHTCARLRGGGVKCWGRGQYGRLGYGNSAHLGGNLGDMGDALAMVSLGSGRSATSLYHGWFGNCVSMDDATHRCWGANVRGELGLGNTDNLGDNGGEMGDALPVFAPGEDIASIYGGYHVWCVITQDRALKCMGNNESGLLGIGSVENYGDEPGETWASLSPIDLGTGRILRGVSTDNIAIGLTHMCALLDDFRIRCWGDNATGQLFLGDVANRGDEPGEMGDALPSFRP